jgi:hypothetical protein
MTERLIKTIPVSDTLTLNIFDASKKIAGDRWQVTMTARMAMTVDDFFSDKNPGDPPAADIKTALGDAVTWEIIKQRNFIDAKEKEAVLQQILDVFETLSVPYLSHPEFARKFILKQFFAQQKRLTR